MSQVLTRAAFENAIRVNAAIGGSTNAVLHLLALAGRIGVELELDDFDHHGRDVPLLVDIAPSGRFLMEEFFHAGGVPAVIRALGDLIDPAARSVAGVGVAEAARDAPWPDEEVIRPRARPVRERAGIAVLRGNLAPAGAVIKPAAASPALLRHRGPAVVFDSFDDLRARLDDPALVIDEDSVMVLKGSGPRGYPGMPEIGNLPLPKRLLRRGVTDLVRISDARMSGTSYGTVVLHVAPESAAGGPLAVVRDGDPVILDVESRELSLDVPDAELERRRADWAPPARRAASGYQRLYVDHVLQADRGVDFDFLVGMRGAHVEGDNH